MARVGHRSLGSVASVIALVGGTLLVAVPPSAAATCEVTNAGTGTTYTTLQEAVNDAASGDTLEVRGTCVGRTVIRTTPLRLKGSRRPSSRPLRSTGPAGEPVLVRQGTVAARSYADATGGDGAPSIGAGRCPAPPFAAERAADAASRRAASASPPRPVQTKHDRRHMAHRCATGKRPDPVGP